MTRLRFSIAQLMAVVLFVGFGFAALRNANASWSSATFSLAIITSDGGLVAGSILPVSARPLVAWAGVIGGQGRHPGRFGGVLGHGRGLNGGPVPSIVAGPGGTSSHSTTDPANDRFIH